MKTYEELISARKIFDQNRFLSQMNKINFVKGNKNRT